VSFEMVTYADLAKRLQCSQEAARSLAKRLKLRRWLGGCYVALDDLRLTPSSEARSGSDVGPSWSGSQVDIS
jgi:hypothetical protein